MGRILIIDDEPRVRASLRRVLEHQGHEVHEAADGQLGVAAFGRGSFDVVITDILMPNQDGIETIRELRRRHPSVKIIAMSEDDEQPVPLYLRIARELGADEVLMKPPAEPRVAEAVTACLP